MLEKYPRSCQLLTKNATGRLPGLQNTTPLASAFQDFGFILRQNFGIAKTFKRCNFRNSKRIHAKSKDISTIQEVCLRLTRRYGTKALLGNSLVFLVNYQK